MFLLRPLTNSLSLSLGLLLGSQTVLRAAIATHPFPMPHQFGKLLDHPLRMQYRNVSETLGLFGFSAGMTVLDLGCGTGTFTVEMARMVGKNGLVHAADLQQPLLNASRQHVAEAGLSERVKFHNCAANKMPLTDESVDLVVMIATLGEIADKIDVLAEIRRVLKRGGRLAISEELPDPAYLPPMLVRQHVEEAGLQMLGRLGNPFCFSMLFLNP